MDFQSMKRRELQALCKKNNIPANLTNAAMADALSSLPFVEGLEEFLRDPSASDPGSPQTSLITSPYPLSTSTRQQIQASALPTTTRCGTRRRPLQGTDARPTPATRSKASQHPTSHKPPLKHLQADFEADMDQSHNTTLLGEIQVLSEDFAAVSVNHKEQPPLESQNESKSYEVVSDVQEIFVLDDNKENLDNNDAVSKDQEEPTEVFNSTQKVDFHSLSRKDLQSLCKKNKILANTTNATMADSLESLENVEGLEEFLKECNSQAPHSPTMSEMTSSCARQTWTSRRIAKEPTSSKLVTKSCRGSRRKVIEDIEEEKTASETPEVVATAFSMKIVSNTLTSDGNSRPLNIDNVKQLEDSESQKDADNVDHISIGGSEAPEQLQDMMNNIDENVQTASSACVSKDAKVFSDAMSLGSESINSQLENGNENTSTVESEDAGSENGSENKEFHVDDGSIERLNTEVFSDAGAGDLYLVEKLAGVQEDQVCEKFDVDFITPVDQPPVFGNNAETGLEVGITNSDFEAQSFPVEQIESYRGIELNTSRNCAALLSHPIEKLEPNTEKETSGEADSESSILTDLRAAEGIETPLDKKSLRKLKKMLKDKLQTTILAKEMGNLTLEETDDPLPKVEEVVEEEYEDAEGESDGLFSGVHEAPISAVISGDTDKQVCHEDLKALSETIDESYMGNCIEVSRANFDVNAPDLHPVNKLMDNLTMEDSVSGAINVEMLNEKYLNITPSKTPMSLGRMSNVSDVNKENIDHSGSRTESAKFSGARSGNALSAMSMTKLKKAVEQQQQQQHSEKKRPALQVRSENMSLFG